MIGKVLNGRYELKELLGEGGMALVYKAKDQILDRWVALKILRPQLVSDKDFVRRFHREAKAVARLSHPNVVNIYDIGQDDDIHYLVMEHIDGDNLKEMIEEKGVFEPTTALEIAIQMCEALEVAHRNNIIHCDIKPHNILITRDGKVKVTDFGIARAVNSATLAQTETVIGTAHYFSPEQAKGSKVNAKSDLYSLGVVLYEMLTGKVPFTGDSPISVALKHINEEAEPPSKYNTDLPARIDKLIMKAMAKDADDRYSSATEMLDALKGMVKTFRKPDQVNYHDSDQTQVMPKISEDEYEGKVKKRKDNDGEKGEGFVKVVKALIALIITFFILGLVGLWGLEQYTKVPVVEVPKFIGMSKNEAETTGRKEGLRVVFNDFKVASPDIPVDHVASQGIEPGKEVKKNRSILLTLSKGATLTTVPNLIGKEMREVKVALHEKDLILGEVEYQFTDKIPKGQVMTQDPTANEEVKSGIEVNLVFSKGAEPVSGTVPNVIGLAKEEARRRIEEANFIVGEITEEETNRFKSGQVASQEPGPGTEISEGTPIDLVVSKGLRNVKGSEVGSYNIKVNIPQGPYNQRLKVVVVDDNGEDIVYNQVHHPDDYVPIGPINTVGPTIIRVYINDNLIQEKRIGF